MGIHYGGKPHYQAGQKGRLPVPPDGASVGGLHRLQPRRGAGSSADGLAKFKRFAVRVWGIDPTGKSDEEVAAAGVEALADFIKEIGLPTTLRELGVDESIDLGIIAASCNVAPGSYGKMCHAEIAAIFSECR